MTKRTHLVAFVLATAVASQDVDARLASDIHPSVCSHTSARDATSNQFVQVLCRLSNESFLQLITLASSNDQDDGNKVRWHLERVFDVNQESQQQFLIEVLKAIGKLTLPPNRLRNRFVMIATRHLSLADNLRNAPVSNADIQRLREQASDALMRKPKKLLLAQSKLGAALDLACDPTGERPSEPCKSDPITTQLLADLAWLEEGSMNFPAAAEFYERASITDPNGDRTERIHRLTRAALLWRDHGEINGQSDAFRQSARIYQRMLSLVSRKTSPLDWARIQISYGGILQELGDRGFDISKLQQSAAAFRKGLQILEENGAKRDQAIARSKLATTLQLLGKHGASLEPYHQAIRAFRRSLSEMKRDDAPRQWAAIQNNLGTTLWNVGKITKDHRMMERAVRAFRAALTVWTPNHHRQNWILAQNNFGNALNGVGTGTGDLESIERSINVFRSLLDELEPDQQPQDWAMTQQNLGLALWTFGLYANRPVFFKDAADAYHLALEKIKRKDAPFDWANIQHGLGVVFFSMAEARQDAKTMQDAVTTLRSALDVRQHTPGDRAITQDVLGRAHLYLGSKNNDINEFNRALDAFKDAQRIRVFDAKVSRFGPFYSHIIKAIEARLSAQRTIP